MTSPDPSPANRDSPPDAPAGEPLRSVHTASFAVLLEQLGLSLLVSTYQAGKVVVLRSEQAVLNTHFCGFKKPMGMALREDRCHLNGLGLYEGRPRFVTALGTTDTAGAWREHKRDGGVLIDIATNEVLLSGLSMPHSPRWYDGRLWVLNSGEGEIGYVSLNGPQIDVSAGRARLPPSRMGRNDVFPESRLGGSLALPINNSYQPLTTLPGFTRGLDFCGRYAFVGLSQVRESAVFSGIQIAERPQAERFCGVWVIDIVTGEIVAWVKFEDALQEIFAVCVVPNRRWPEITNSNIGLISNSFVLPEEVLDTVPSELLKRVTPWHLDTSPTRQRVNQDP